MNVDKNIASWAFSLLKYGDVYLKLFRESDYQDRLFSQDKINMVSRTKLNESAGGEEDLDEAVKLRLHSIKDPYSYYIEMVPDPSTMFELTKFGRTYGYIEVPNVNLADYGLTQTYVGAQTVGGQTNLQFNYKYMSNDINIYQADDYVHACLEDNISRFPETVELFTNDEDLKNSTNAQAYTVKRGKSMLYDSYKVWREKQLLESAVLLNRVTRSSIIRPVGVEVGNMSKEQSAATLRRVKELFEQKSAINTGKSFTEYNNPSAIENNIYYTTHNGQGAITVGLVGGDINVKDLADLDNWINKFYASYGIPKAYFGYTDDGAGFNGGESLSIISSTYAKGVKKAQNALLQALTDAINLILLNKGCKSYLNNFVLKMKAPLTKEEQNYRQNLTDRVNAISNFNSLFTDIEDKSSRLEIVKNLVATLNYGDEIMEVLDKEIEKATKAEEEATKQAEEEKKAAEELGVELPPEETGGGEEAPAEEAPAEEGADMELPPVPESFNTGTGEPLFEDALGLENDDILPLPEELNKDFTDNRIRIHIKKK